MRTCVAKESVRAPRSWSRWIREAHSHGARTVQTSLVIMFIPWSRAIHSVVRFPAHWPMRGCLVEEVALLKGSWCAPLPSLLLSCALIARHFVRVPILV